MDRISFRGEIIIKTKFTSLICWQWLERFSSSVNLVRNNVEC